MPTHVTGSFDVALKPLNPEDSAEGVSYHGDLDATAVGVMLTAGAESTGAGAYVAIERVTGTLQGRRGAFALMHSGTMTRDAMHLSVVVAPGSGMGQLVGLTGTLTITIVDSKHLYDFEYTLPPES
jgi:hypothetical protein